MTEPPPTKPHLWRLSDWLMVVAIIGVALAIVRLVATAEGPREVGAVFVALILSIPFVSGLALVRIWRTSTVEDRRELMLVWLILTVAAFVGLVTICVWSGAAHPRAH